MKLSKSKKNQRKHIILLRKSSFLTIQLLPQFGFSHQTSKLDIFYHSTFKTVHNWPSVGFDGGFNFLFTILSLELEIITNFFS
jgi:hypothetical protein